MFAASCSSMAAVQSAATAKLATVSSGSNGGSCMRPAGTTRGWSSRRVWLAKSFSGSMRKGRIG